MGPKCGELAELTVDDIWHIANNCQKNSLPRLTAEAQKSN